MLHARAEAARDQAAEEGEEASREARGHEAERGHRRARGEESRLAPALGEEPRGDLEGRHAPAVECAEEPDLGEVEAELARPHGQEDVEDVGEAVVDEVGAAGGAENGAGAAHAPEYFTGATLEAIRAGGPPQRARRVSMAKIMAWVTKRAGTTTVGM